MSVDTAVADNPATTTRDDASYTSAAIALYDGRCVLCNKLLQFATKRARPGKIQFMTLQSNVGQELQRRFAFDPDDLDSMILVVGDKAYSRSDASLRLLRCLRQPWPMFSALLIVPRPIRNAIYIWIARNRIRWFGTCELPADQTQ